MYHVVFADNFHDAVQFELISCAIIQNDLTPLHQAICYGRIDIVSMLLTHGANPNAQNTVRAKISASHVLYMYTYTYVYN